MKRFFRAKQGERLNRQKTIPLEKGRISGSREKKTPREEGLSPHRCSIWEKNSTGETIFWAVRIPVNRVLSSKKEKEG